MGINNLLVMHVFIAVAGLLIKNTQIYAIRTKFSRVWYFADFWSYKSQSFTHFDFVIMKVKW